MTTQPPAGNPAVPDAPERLRRAWEIRKKYPVGTARLGEPDSETGYVEEALKASGDPIVFITGKSAQAPYDLAKARKEGWEVAASVGFPGRDALLPVNELYAVALTRAAVGKTLVAWLGNPGPALEPERALKGKVAQGAWPKTLAADVAGRVASALSGKIPEAPGAKAVEVAPETFDPLRPSYRRYDPELARESTKLARDGSLPISELCDVEAGTRGRSRLERLTKTAEKVPCPADDPDDGRPCVHLRRDGFFADLVVQPGRGLPKSFFVVKPKDPEKVTPEYLRAVFRTTAFRAWWKRFSTQSTVLQRMTAKALLGAKIPVPDDKALALAKELDALEADETTNGELRRRTMVAKARRKDRSARVPHDLLLSLDQFKEEAAGMQEAWLRAQFEKSVRGAELCREAGLTLPAAVLLRRALECVCIDWLAALEKRPIAFYGQKNAQEWGDAGDPTLHKIILRLKELGKDVAKDADAIRRLGNGAHVLVSAGKDPTLDEIGVAKDALGRIVNMRQKN